MSLESQNRPRIGVPYRTLNEELTRKREKYERYLHSIRLAGGEPIEVSLQLTPDQLKTLAGTLDAVILPGSPADVNPSRYGTTRHRQTADPDLVLEQTDRALLDHCFGESKPVLAICYGVQFLNVYLGGSLVQDISSEIATKIRHEWKGREAGAPEPNHMLHLDAGLRLAQIAGATEALVNSSHHQAIREPGRGLRIAARAADGVIEGVEWTGGPNWVTGVQWHPERQWPAAAAGTPQDRSGERLAEALFHELVAVARGAQVRD